LFRQTRFGAISTFCLISNYDSWANITSCNNCLATLRDITIPPEEIFVECKFKNELINCIESFEEIILPMSVCYSFNGLDVYRQEDSNNDPKEWSTDKGYEPGATLDTYPRRGTAAGIRFGFSVLLKLNKKDYDESCSDPGFRV
jgi:Amiloride-sensitive sodium channel